MNKKISLTLAIILILNIFLNVPFVFAAEEACPICVFNLANLSESFDEASVFVVETKNSSDKNAAFGLKLSGTMDGSTQCNIRVYDANGNLAKSTVKNKKTTLSKENYEQIIYPIPAATRYNFLSRKQEQDFNSPDYNKISEDVFTVNIKKPETKDKSYKYYIIIEPMGCSATVTEINSDNCKVNTLDNKDYDLVNFTIASKYYNTISVKPMYMYPYLVAEYINSNSVENVPFSYYDDMINYHIPSGDGVPALIANGMYKTLTNIKLLIEQYKSILGKEVIALLHNDIYDTNDITVAELQRMYEDILKKIVPVQEKSLVKELTSTDTIKYYKNAAKAIKLYDLSELPSEYGKYSSLIKVLNTAKSVKTVVSEIEDVRKWTEISDDFIAAMLLAYDSKALYIDALDNLYAGVDLPQHKEAIEKIRKRYSENFVDRFWYSVEQSGIIKELGGRFLGFVFEELGLDKLSLYIDVFDFAANVAFKHSGLGNHLDKYYKITLSAPVAEEIEKKMEEIQLKQHNGTATTEELQNYACLFDIAKSIRVYQLEAIKNYYGDFEGGEKEQAEISNLIDTVKSINITYDVTEKTGVEYKGRYFYKTVPDDGNNYMLITFNEHQTVEEYLSEYKNAPYTLYNGDGVDLKVHYSGAISSDNIVYSFNKPKLEINCGSKKEDAVLTGYIEDGEEIDLSYYGIANGEKVTYICLVFDDVEEFSSKQEYNEQYGYSDDDWSSDRDYCIAYNYIENETPAGSGGGRF